MIDKLRYQGGYKYRVVGSWSCSTPIVGSAARIESVDGGKPWVQLDQDGTLHVRDGYMFDGASGPTIDTDSSMRASLAHDALYQLEREGHLGQEWRAAADQLLHDLCVEDGMWRWRARLWLWALRRFAASSAAYQPAVVREAP